MWVLRTTPGDTRTPPSVTSSLSAPPTSNHRSLLFRFSPVSISRPSLGPLLSHSLSLVALVPSRWWRCGAGAGAVARHRKASTGREFIIPQVAPPHPPSLLLRPGPPQHIISFPHSRAYTHSCTFTRQNSLFPSIPMSMPSIPQRMHIVTPPQTDTHTSTDHS